MHSPLDGRNERRIESYGANARLRWDFGDLSLHSISAYETVHTFSRGDIDGASFRFDVGQEAWEGDVRTVKTVKALHDVTVATFPAYPAASVELRTKPARRHRRWTKQPCRPRAARKPPSRTGNRTANGEHRHAAGDRTRPGRHRGESPL